MFDFIDKVAIVTGGTRGIGRTISKLLVDTGAYVAVIYRSNDEKAQSLKKEVAHPEAFRLYKCDVSDGEALSSTMETVFNEFWNIDVLINNAGIWMATPVMNMDMNIRDQTIDINLKGVMNGCQAVVPFMAQSGGGVIVNVSSTAGQRGEKNYSTYAATKGGIISYTKSLAAELAPDNIRVNAVAPGWVNTEMTRQAIESRSSEILREIPLGRVAQPIDVAMPVLFLASEAAQFIAGEVLNVNGGSVLCG